jgi:hypothetical protein
MPVRPLFTLICDDVRVESSNKLIIIGLYNKIINFQAPTIVMEQITPGKPTVTSTPVMQFALPFLTLVRRWIVTEPGRKAQTSIVDPNGKSTLVGETQLPVPPNDEPLQEVLRLAGIILMPGVYTIKTTYTNVAQEEYNEQFEVRVTGGPATKPSVDQGAVQ